MYLICRKDFCVAYTKCNPHCHHLTYLFICLQELSPCHVVNEEDWVPVSGQVSHFARGIESFNFIPCFFFEVSCFIHFELVFCVLYFVFLRSVSKI